MRRALLGAAAGAAILVAAPRAEANGRFPASNQILFAPSDPTHMVVRTTFGILFTNDAAATWRWLCEDTLGLPPISNEDPYLGITAGGNVVAGLSLGLELSTDSGCGWSTAGGMLAGQHVRDLDVRKDNAHAIDLITSTYGAMNGADGGVGYTQQTFESTDDGATWTPFGVPVDPSAVVTTIDVAPSDPNRVYVSAFRGSGMARTASLFVSKDKGAHYTEYPAPLDPANETAVYIGAVDATNPDVVYLRSEGLSTVSVTQNAGQTFQRLHQMHDQMLGLALSPDGSKLYVGSVADGLLMAPTSTFAFTTQNAKVHVQCLVATGTDLWACSDEVSGFVAGVSQDDGKTFTPKLHLLDIAGPIACSASSPASQCTAWTTDAGVLYDPFVGICGNLGACFDGGPPTPLYDECTCTGACTAAANSDINAYHPNATCPDAGSSSSGGGSGGGSGGSGSGGSSSGAASGGSASGSSCAVGTGLPAAGAFAAAGSFALASLLVRRKRRRQRGQR